VDRSGATRFIGPVGASPLPGTATLALEAPRRAGDGALEDPLPARSPASDLRLVVIDVAGRRIRT
jgi:hypothetical protein